VSAGRSTRSVGNIVNFHGGVCRLSVNATEYFCNGRKTIPENRKTFIYQFTASTGVLCVICLKNGIILRDKLKTFNVRVNIRFVDEIEEGHPETLKKQHKECTLL